VQRGHCCKFCAENAKVTQKQAHQLFTKANFTPLEAFSSAHVSILVRCNVCGKDQRKCYSNVKWGRGCRFCARNAPVDEETARKLFASRKLQPLQPFKKADAPWKSQCMNCLNIVHPSYSNVRSGKGCRYCGGNTVNTKAAKALMTRRGYIPLIPYPGAHHRWKCRHQPCGNIIYPQYAQIQQGDGGCRFCAVSGFRYNKKSYLYFAHNGSAGSFKVGVANENRPRKDRLSSLIRDGWILIRRWDFDTGKHAFAVERQFFKVIRERFQIPQHLNNKQLKYAGATETFSSEAISKRRVVDLINMIAKH
jgi:hypothetical protein